MDTLYHYCSLDTLISILKSKKIGFNVETLENIVKSCKNFHFGKVSYLDEQSYNASTFQDIVDIIVQQVMDAINTDLLERILTNPYGADIFDRWGRLEIFQKSVFYKNSSFIPEQEHRMVYNPDVWKSDFIEEYDSVENAALFPDGVQFRSVGNDLVSYLDLNIESYCNDFIIDKIVIGPNCNTDEDDIKLMLKHTRNQLCPP